MRDECVAQGLNPARIITVPADVTKAADLVKVRDEVVKGEVGHRNSADRLAWDGFDTLHILAGVPSTRTLLKLAGVELVADPSDKSAKPRLIAKSEVGDLPPSDIPTVEGLDKLAIEARAASDINFVGTVLALATFVSMLHAAIQLTFKASSARLFFKVPCCSPPVIRRRLHCSALPLHLLSHKGRGPRGRRGCPCRV